MPFSAEALQQKTWTKLLQATSKTWISLGKNIVILIVSLLDLLSCTCHFICFFIPLLVGGFV
jgi:hypothetical protein